jgi:GMP synthase (glutamine-hydrolysing)
MKILLLQARDRHDEARHEERASFASAAGLPVGDIKPFDLLTGTPTLADILAHDALFIGGSGDYYVSKGNLPGTERVLSLLRAVVSRGWPTFASCFGYQLLVKALGGEIVYDPGTMQVGTYQLQLTAAGQEDELFGRLPASFPAQIGRKDRAASLPPNTLNLAGSEAVPFMALRVPGKPIWGTQFHPELTREDNLKRFHRYKNGYTGIMSPTELQATLDRFGPSEETAELLARFASLVARLSDVRAGSPGQLGRAH